MRHHLAGLASHAAALGSGVLLTVDEVHAGEREEIRRLAGDLQHITPAWDDLHRSDQQYLKIVVSLGDAAARRDIASLASADPSALSRSERRLRALGYVALSDDDTVSMTGILTPDVVQEAIDAEAGYTISETKRSKCNEEMPRAKATCILPDGHTGRHRSK